MKNAIDIKNLTKIYQGDAKKSEVIALDNVSLQVKAGSIYGLLGPNGAGKSTLLNIIVGLVMKTKGSVNIWGFDIDANPRQAKMSIGAVPQEINTDVFFTPQEALEIQAGLFGIRKKDRITEELLSAMSLSDKRDAYLRHLSGGMKRRLCVAKAMVHSPPILILDEPTAGVDIELRKQLWEYVVKLNEKGVTIILTTHYLEEAQQLCDRIAIIDQGKVRVEDDKKVLLSSLDKKVLLIDTIEEITNMPEIEPLSAHLEKGQIIINYHPSKDKVSDIIELLKKHNITIRDVTTRQANLEDVFMALTYHKLD